MQNRLGNFWAGIAVGLLIVAAPAFAGVATYNINEAFVANEIPEPGAETNPFAGPLGGTITLGYNLTPTTPATFLTTGLIHTDTFNGNANVEGVFVQNSALVPALLVNTTNALLAANFGSTFAPHEILLHPGNPGGDAFAQPASAAVLRYTIPTTGQYQVDGFFESMAAGAVNVDILRNGASILPAGAGSDATPFNVTTTFTAGDLLDFVVDDGGDIGADSTGLFANVSQVPEPATLGLLGLPAAAMLTRRRRA